MHSNNLLTFVKNILYLQLFLLVIIAGVGIDLGSPKLAAPLRLDQYSLRLQLPVVGVNSELALDLIGFNSVALAGQHTRSGLWLDQSEIGQKLMVANLSIPVSRGEQPVQKMEEIELPLAKDGKNDYEGKYYDDLEDYKVVLYCTHSSESYIPDSGKERVDDGKKGLVITVAHSVAERLEFGGIQADVVDRIHDYPDYNKSYTSSRKTVQDLVSTEKKLVALFDIHRDHIPEAESAETVNIKGKMAARILIIVGTDERKEHPHWEENHAFAEKIYQQGEKMYPGLIKGVRTRPGTYNQEFFNHSLLLEFGTDYNSLAEAQHAADLFAEILLEVLEEEVNQ